jgi:hypothetical protein
MLSFSGQLKGLQNFWALLGASFLTNSDLVQAESHGPGGPVTVTVDFFVKRALKVRGLHADIAQSARRHTC